MRPELFTQGNNISHYTFKSSDDPMSSNRAVFQSYKNHAMDYQATLSIIAYVDVSLIRGTRTRVGTNCVFKRSIK